MKDTINLEYRYKEQEEQLIINFIKANLIIHSNTDYFKRLGSSLIAEYECWKFIMGKTNLKIIGSPTTDSKGNNIYNSTYEDVKESLDRLKKLLSFLDISRMRFTRIDIAYCCLVKCSLNRYLPLLQCPDGYKEVIHSGESQRFYNRNFEFKFYDKVLERKKNGHLPAKYRGLNVLRYEMTFKAGGLKKVGLANLNLGNFDEDDYFTLVSAWFRYYQSIPKIEDELIPMPIKPSIKSYKNYAVKFLLSNALGRKLDFNFMKNKAMTPKNRCTLKKYKSELFWELNTNGELCTELTNLILRAYVYAIPDRHDYAS